MKVILDDHNCVICSAVIPASSIYSCSSECYDKLTRTQKISESKSKYGHAHYQYPVHFDAFGNMFNAVRYEDKEASSEFTYDLSGFIYFLESLGVVPLIHRPCRGRINHSEGYNPENMLWISWADNNKERNKRIITAGSANVIDSTPDELIVMVSTMSDLQSTINSIVNPNWIQDQNEWNRAILVESAELMDHSSWKWWKYSVPDTAQQHLELVDIFHFILSWNLMLKGDGAHLAMLMHQFDSWYVPGEDPKLRIEKLARAAASSYLYGCVEYFVYCCRDLGLSLDELYLQYVFKNSLNIFRQLNGYKEGTYRKNTWGVSGTHEDNEFLAGLMTQYRAEGEVPTPDQILEKLAINYPGK